MKKRIIILVAFIFLLSMSIICGREYHIREAMKMSEVQGLNDQFYNEYERISDKFIKQTFITSEHTVLNNQSILASLNLLYLEYLLETSNQEEFKQAVRFIQENLLTEEGLVAFGGFINEGDQDIEHINKSSLQDNFEFYKLLTKAHLAWDDFYYNDLAEKIADKIFTYHMGDKRLYPYYDKEGEDELLDLPLYYLDLKVLASLSEHEALWKEIYQTNKGVLESAYINNNFPLYYSYYDYDEKQYIKNEKIDTLDSLLVVKQLVYNNLHKKETIQWLKNQLKTGGIYEQYNSKTGLVTSHTEKIAIYAVTAQIGKMIGDIELYTLAMEKMLSFQVKDAESEFYGAFMTKDTDEIDCYTNVQALLAF